MAEHAEETGPAANPRVQEPGAPASSAASSTGRPASSEKGSAQTPGPSAATQLALLEQQLKALALHVSNQQSRKGDSNPSGGGTSPPVAVQSRKVPEATVQMLDSVPRYSGDGSLKRWKLNVVAFTKTFHLKMPQLEPHLGKLLEGRALSEYNELRKQMRQSKGLRYPNWTETIQAMSHIDEPVRRSLATHDKLLQLKGGSSKDTIDAFAALELQLDPAPLGDRLHLLVTVLPAFKELLLANLDKITTLDDAYELIKAVEQ